MAGFGEIGGFNANEHEPSAQTVPAGEYDVIITESKWEPTKNGSGKFLKLKLQIISGPQQNRVLFDRLNLVNQNPQAVQIAKGTLSAICRAVNVLTPQDSAELHGRPMKATVTCKTDPQHGPSNEVKGYKARHAGGVPTSPPVPAGGPAPAAAGVAPVQTPW